MRSGSLFTCFHATCMWEAGLDFSFLRLFGQIILFYFFYIFLVHCPEFCCFLVRWNIRWGCYASVWSSHFVITHTPHLLNEGKKITHCGFTFQLCAWRALVWCHLFLIQSCCVCFLFDFPSKCWSVKRKKKTLPSVMWLAHCSVALVGCLGPTVASLDGVGWAAGGGWSAPHV